jgi:hypothetical protein
MTRTLWPSLLLGGALLAHATVGAEAPSWQPPAGIPHPPFGVVEKARARPTPWAIPVTNYYYVDPAHPSSTDAGAYGTPGAPRKTIPSVLSAGAVVELHGTYDRSHTFTLNGTPGAPVFIRGQDARTRPTITQEWSVKGTYFVLEHLVFADRDGRTTGAVGVDGPASFGAFRDSDISGNLDAGGFWTGGGAHAVSNIVVLRNKIHDNGNVHANVDQDRHGLNIGQRSSFVWVLDNEMSRNSGDGIQINPYPYHAATASLVHHIFVGRNVSHHNKQGGFWVKQSEDVIFSQNIAHGHRPSDSSPGHCMGGQYGPTYVWFVFNEMHDCDFGVYLASDNDLGSGQEMFFIGNVVHHIHASGPYNPNTAWSNAAFMLAGGVNHHVVNNTLYHVDAGVNVPAPAGSVRVVNNIIGGLLQPQGRHVFIEKATNATVASNLFQGAVRIAGPGETYTSLASFESATRKGLRNLNASPGFLDVSSPDFRLAAGSPAIDRGILDDVYATFQRRYGVSLSTDIQGTPRPQGAAWDIGAYEVGDAVGGTPRR